MANLKCEDFTSGRIDFNLSPVGVAGRDTTEYALSLCYVDASVTEAYTFSVDGWQMGQDNIWVVSRTFAESPVLLDVTLPIDLWRIGSREKAHLCASIDWLEVHMFAIPKQKKIRIILYIRHDTTCQLYRRFFLQAGVEETHRFGIELEQEIISAAPDWARQRGHDICNTTEI